MKCLSDANYVTLTPRTALRAAPYALYSQGNWGLGGNSGTGGAGFVGTTDNTALTIGVNGQAALRAYPNAQSPNLVGGYSGNYLTPTIFGATIAGGGAFSYENRVLREFCSVGGGRKNEADGYASTVAGGTENRAGNDYATVAGGLRNYATGNASAIGGGFYNVAEGYVSYVGGGDLNVALTQNATIGGGYSNTLAGGQSIANGTIGGGVFNYGDGFASTIAGGHGNRALAEWTSMGGGGFNTASGKASTVPGGAYNIANGPGATIGGGGWNGNAYDGNEAYALASTIGGGFANLIAADGRYGTIAGGSGNAITASAGANLYLATIGGGANNKITLGGATIAGGNSNTASAFDATVGGGINNTASGGASVVPGGTGNQALGYASLAAGQQAIADSSGCFVFNDNTNLIRNCGGPNRFVVRSSGGVWFYTSANDLSGVNAAAGSGSWSAVSDRNAKANFIRVDPGEALARVAAMPINTWNYKTQDAEIRHIGPTAQDFKAAFGVGEDDTHISMVDADGVALAAIQGVNLKVQAENTELRARLAAIEARLDGAPAPLAPLLWAASGAALAIAILAGIKRMRRP